MELLSGRQAAQSFLLGALKASRHFVHIGRRQGSGLLFGGVQGLLPPAGNLRYHVRSNLQSWLLLPTALSSEPKKLAQRGEKSALMEGVKNSAGADLQVCEVVENAHLKVCASRVILDFFTPSCRGDSREADITHRPSAGGGLQLLR
jgi:hypothetical protein